MDFMQKVDVIFGGSFLCVTMVIGLLYEWNYQEVSK